MVRVKYFVVISQNSNYISINSVLTFQLHDIRETFYTCATIPAILNMN